MARQLAAADRRLGGRLLAQPGEQRGHRLRLGGEIAFGGEGWLGRDIAAEIGVDGIGIRGARSSLAERVSRSAGEVSLRSKPTRMPFQSKSPLAVSGSTRWAGSNWH
jgi:hypothetical protein